MKQKADSQKTNQTGQKPIRLGDTPWPMIHCNLEGTKEAKGPGPVRPVQKAQYFDAGSMSIIMVMGKRYLYYQADKDWLYAFAPDDIRKPRFRFPTEKVGYPDVGGGVVDNEGHVWWTVKNRVVRLDEQLKNPVYSQPMKPEDIGYNTVNILPDGNLLVICKIAAHVVSSREKKGSFPILSTTNLQDIFQIKLPSPAIAVIPRPMVDGRGNIYMNANQTVCKLSYDQKRQRLLPQPVWTYENPLAGGAFVFNNPVFMDGRVWTITGSKHEQRMLLTCLDAEDGTVIGQMIPFPLCSNGTTWHTLGAVPGKGLIITICNNGYGKGGGVAAIDGKTLQTAWFFPLKNISGSFCLSRASDRVYVSNKEADDAPFRFWAISLEDGKGTVIHQMESDGNPPPSLPVIGYNGNLYYPGPTNLVKLQDS